jgi:hypothetical protein
VKIDRFAVRPSHKKILLRGERRQFPSFFHNCNVLLCRLNIITSVQVGDVVLPINGGRAQHPCGPGFQEVVMKATTIFHLALALFIIPFLLSGVLIPQQAQAQDSDYLASSGEYSQEELAQMLAPIALYPDALLSQVLMASTYPIEVIEADRWVRLNPRLKDEALDVALLDKNWDPSVKAIAQFPSILALMSERITETTELGNAFLAQEAEVMGTVQRLRAKAYAQGNLATTSQQQVIVEKQTIVIQPADPRIIYVPYYDPFHIYGPWWYPAYPPYYWGPSGVSIGYGVSYWPGFYFRVGFNTWSYFDWHRHYIYIDVHKRPRYVRHDRWLVKPGPWQHAPSHRRGVAYRDMSTARKYGQPLPRAREIGRDNRGYYEQRQDLHRRGNERIVIDRSKREDDRARIDRDRQQRARKESEAGRDGQGQQRVERERQSRVEQGRDERVPQEPEQQEGRRENVVKPAERSERQASERGQVSRKAVDDDSASRGRPRGNDQRDDDRGRNRH